MTYSERYIHDYPSCSCTYVTLCIYHKTADPKEISVILNLVPDRLFKVGEFLGSGKISNISGWFLSTEDICLSKDFRSHVDWILDKLSNKINELKTLLERGYQIRFFCFWKSVSGNGGPMLDNEFIKRLSGFPIDLEFDIWFDD